MDNLELTNLEVVTLLTLVEQGVSTTKIFIQSEAYDDLSENSKSHFRDMLQRREDLLNKVKSYLENIAT